MAKKKLMVADLFCGAGGSSTGVTTAAERIGRAVELVAVNHWDRAVETHAKNHPKANHFCQDLTRLRPAEAVPGGRLDLLVASPECTHHSNARGGKPKHDQSRASAWVVVEWINALDVAKVLIENVPEFVTWGPLDRAGKPIKSKRGTIFAAFIAALKSSGYRVEWRTLNAADYGAATSRRRLFIQAAKGRRPIVWPEHTHARAPAANLFGATLQRWRAAREIIDWSLRGESIFFRKRPLRPNTMARIEAGLRKFGGQAGEPFIAVMNYLKQRGHDNRSVRSIDEPLPTITAQGNRFAFIVPANYGERPGQAPRCHSADGPVPTVVAGGITHGVVEPLVCKVAHSGDDNCRNKSIEEPIGTLSTSNQFGLVEPLILSAGGPTVDARPVSEPFNTVLTRDHMGLAEPFIMNMSQSGSNGDRLNSVEQPIGTITTAQDRGIVQPFIVPYNGTARPDSIEEPLATVTTTDRLSLAEPAVGQVRCGLALDVGFRMFRPHELKRAMGFPEAYIITGNQEEQVKQIGNAVEIYQATALAEVMI